MMKTTRAHPASFLAFACRLQEDVDWAQVLPDVLLSTGEFDNEGAAAIAEFHAAEGQSMLEAIRQSLERQIAEGGPTPSSHNPVLGRVLDEHAGQLASLLNIVDSSQCTQASRDRFCGSPWRPSRSTVVGVIFGAWLASGAKEHVGAIDLLNRHAPKIGSELIGYGHVRDAIARSVRTNAAPSSYLLRRFDLQLDAQAEYICYSHVAKFRVLAALWERIHAVKGLNRVETYVDTLRSNGKLLRMYGEERDVERVSRAEARRLATPLMIEWLRMIAAREGRTLDEFGLRLPSRNAVRARAG